MRKHKITVKTFDGYRDVPGYVNHSFGVHHELTDPPLYYKITHLPTGMSMPGRFLYHRQAKAMANAFDKINVVGEITDEANHQAIKDAFAALQAKEYIEGEEFHFYRR